MSFALIPRRAHRAESSLARDADRLFDALWDGFPSLPSFFAGDRPAGFVPQLDVVESETEYRVTAELPGLEEKDFSVVWEGDVLTLKGEKRSHSEVKQGGTHRSESATGRFERRLRFPQPVQADRIEAAYKNGVLSVTLPKPEQARPSAREIPVQGS